MSIEQDSRVQMALKPQWRFREMHPGEINVDPIEGEFFTTEALGSINDALVREAIQNALDASAGTGPVTVRLSFYHQPAPDAAPREIAADYLEGITPHVRARHCGLPEVPPASECFSFLLVEDYGTRGLQGDIYQEDDLDDTFKRNDFFYFWRNIGRTSKGEKDLGRWGLGKTVFPAASRINSFFGLSVRQDDRRTLLMGQSVLKIHKVNGRRYAPYGFFGIFQNGLPLPVENDAVIDTFIKRFSIDRREKPGLSVMIPFPDRDLTMVGVVRSAIKHYFFPILAGRLIFEIRHGEKFHKLDQTSLGAYLKKSKLPEKEKLLGLVDLVRWAIRQPAEAFIRLDAPPAGKVPKLTEDLFPENALAAAAHHFSEGRRLAVHVPLTLQPKHAHEVRHACFDVFLEKNTELEKAEDHFIRQGITIPEVSSLKQKGVRAVVSITDPVLSTFLGDAENPAHTDWERNSRKFKQKYIRGPRTLDFVKTSPREIVKMLTQPPKSRDENLLKHLFALPVDPSRAPGGEPKEAKRPADKTQTDNPFVGIEGSRYLKLSPIKGGFRLMRKAKATKLPRYVTIWAAYEVRSGNPFKKYTPLDFDVSQNPIQISLEGGRMLLCKENTIQVEATGSAFKLTVIGFDPHRDLRVKTNP